MLIFLAAAPTELSQSIENGPFSPLIGEKHPAVASEATRRSQRSTMILEGPIKSLVFTPVMLSAMINHL